VVPKANRVNWCGRTEATPNSSPSRSLISCVEPLKSLPPFTSAAMFRFFQSIAGHSAPRLPPGCSKIPSGRSTPSTNRGCRACCARPSRGHGLRFGCQCPCEAVALPVGLIHPTTSAEKPGERQLMASPKRCGEAHTEITGVRFLGGIGHVPRSASNS
jgi:hypothetical protein